MLSLSARACASPRPSSPPHRRAPCDSLSRLASCASAAATRPAFLLARRSQAGFRRSHLPHLLSAMAEPMEQGGGAPASAKTPADGQAPESTDYANYFCTYSYLYHQKDMLEDHRRTGAYFRAVRDNARQFKGKAVLDVGTGSGILAIFAAQAGARVVYAVEATSMAKQARALVAANGFQDVVQVIQGTIETAELPEKVDIIISEWMGYFLLRESMLDSVLLARDRWLKPGGALYPSHARMLLAPCRTPQAAQRASDFHAAMEGWGEFAGDMARLYGVDLRCLTEPFREEQREYFLRTAAWADVHPSQLMGPGVALKVIGAGPGGAGTTAGAAAGGAGGEGAANGNGNGAASSDELDLLTLQVGQLKNKALEATATLSFAESGRAEGLVGWFDVSFRGSPENPADEPVVLTTEPDADGATHWGQQLFHVHPPLQVVAGERASLRMRLSRREDNHRLLKVQFCLQAPSSGGGGGGGGGALPGGMPPGAARTLDYQIE